MARISHSIAESKSSNTPIQLFTTSSFPILDAQEANSDSPALETLPLPVIPQHVEHILAGVVEAPMPIVVPLNVNEPEVPDPLLQSLFGLVRVVAPVAVDA